MSNILLLEHINLNTSSPSASIAFYLDTLGFVQDPRQGILHNGTVYLNKQLWVNAGINQIHLPITTRGRSGAADNVFQGSIGINVPNFQELRRRLKQANSDTRLNQTKFQWKENSKNNTVTITGPAGNTFVAQETTTPLKPQGYHPGITSWALSIPWVEIHCKPGTSQGIGRYFSTYFDAAIEYNTENETSVSILIGLNQRLKFTETTTVTTSTTPYHLSKRGFHLCIYLQDHDTVLRQLHSLSLLWGNPRFHSLDKALGLTQFRLKDIVDPLSGETLLEVEFEVRSLQHHQCPLTHKQPYLIPDRLIVSPLVINQITNQYEENWNNISKQSNQHMTGFIPNPTNASNATHSSTNKHRHTEQLGSDDQRELSFKKVGGVGTSQIILTQQQIHSFNDNGFLFPITIFNTEEITKHRLYFDQLSKKAHDMGHDNYSIMNWQNRCDGLYDLAYNDKILTLVEEVLGPNLALFRCHYFNKTPSFKGDQRIVAWHQDAPYWPITPSRCVTVWLALSDVNVNNGAMKFVPKSHKNGLIPYVESKKSENNVLNLTVPHPKKYGSENGNGNGNGNEMKDQNEEWYCNVCLRAGQVSLHSDLLLHASGVNLSNENRVGLALTYFVPSEVRSIIQDKRGYGWVCRGIDDKNYWNELPERPDGDRIPRLRGELSSKM